MTKNDPPYDLPPGRRGQRLKVETLPPDLLREYERDVLADPKTTAKVAQQWLRGRGHQVSFAAVTRHRARLAQRAAGRAPATAYDESKRQTAEALRLMPASLAAGQRLRDCMELFEAVFAAFRAATEEGRPATPEQIIYFARRIRAYIG